MGGLKKYMPVTQITFLLACFAIAGMPPFSGFFSKDEILAAAYNNSPLLWGLGVAGAVMTAFYMFRLYAMTFLGNFRGTEKQQHHLHESPKAITIPLIILAILSVIGGWIGIPKVFIENGHRLEAFLKPVFKDSNALLKEHHLSHATEYMLMGVSVAAALAALVYAWNRFSKYQKSETTETGLGKVLANKWYVDELYDSIIVKPVQSIAKYFNQVVEKKGIDGFVNGVGKAVNYGSRQVRLLQSGQVGLYIFMMVLGILIFFIIQLFL
jgi:NADH-quinone oxidoreductase subunit L